MALKNFTQFTPQTVLSATDYLVGYRSLDEIRTNLDSLTDAISGLLVSKGFTPGGTVGSVKRLGYRYTITSGKSLNAVSGTDDYGSILSYNPGATEVYRNGSHLIGSLDYIASNGTQITNLSTMNLGDVVEVSTLSGIPVTYLPIISGGGNAFIASFRYTVNTGNTIVPNATLVSGADDYGMVLNFIAPNLEVYLNGSRLTRDFDFGLYSSGSSFTLNDPVTGGDVLDVITLSGYNLTTTTGITAYSNITNVNREKNILVSKSSGVVTISAKSDICSEISLDDIPVPGWTDGKHISRWSLLQDYLSAVATTNTSPISSIYIGNIAGFGSSNYLGAVLAPNGKIYCVPYNATVCRVINPLTNTVETFGSFPGSTSYIGGALASNGRIYLFPEFAGSVAVIDPSNNTLVTTLGGGGISSSYSFSGGTAAPNGKIYGSPFSSTQILLIDPSSNTFGTFGNIPGTAKCIGAVCGPNGKIYFIPYQYTAGIVVDPSANNGTSAQFFSAKTGNYGFAGGVLAPNGKIYCIPNGTIVGAIDPSSDSISIITTIPFVANGAYVGGVLAPNGKIYFVPSYAVVGMVLDPTTETISTYGSFSGSSAYAYGILAPNGNIYFIANVSTTVAVLNTLNQNNFNTNVCTNPMFNKN
jgi:streptogramin lyase